MVVVPKGFSAAQYEIAFEPYGWGPAGAADGRIVVRITTSKPLDAGAKALDRDFADKNALLFLGPEDARAISTGGTYKGVLSVRPQGDVGLLYLTKVSPAK